jgi:hypothetical protein
MLRETQHLLKDLHEGVKPMMPLLLVGVSICDATCPRDEGEG